MNWWNKAKEFLSETRSEMRKVSFPSRDEVVATTVVVLITSFVFAVFLFAADQVIIHTYQGIVEGAHKVFG
jgi:preprotein translocase subunit SecE